jgi:hypothetical protein
MGDDDEKNKSSPFHHSRVTDPSGRSQRGKEKQRALEPTGSSNRTHIHRSPSPDEMEEAIRSSRRSAREDQNRRAGVGISSRTDEGWRIDGEGIVLHRGTCDICKSYALHVYNHVYDHDKEYLDAKERRDAHINSGVIARAERAYDGYEGDIDALQETIRNLETENEHLKEELEGRTSKRARTREPSPYPERSQGNSYARAISRPSPPAVPRPVAPDEDVNMNEVYPPLPILPPPRYTSSVPDAPRTANWRPAPKPRGQVPTSIPQNTEEFDAWSRSAHTSGNYPMLERMREYMRFVNDTPAGARTPLMSYALANWRLPSWLPVEMQSARGLRRLNDPNRLEQPSLLDSAEAWAQFMHRHLYQWRHHPGTLLDEKRVSLPHVRGQLLLRQQIPSGLSPEAKSLLHLRIAEVLSTPGLYRQIRERERLALSPARRRQPMPIQSTQVSLEDVAMHLASMGVSDAEVREGSHYAVGWLTATATANSSRSDESSIAADIVRRLRQIPNARSEDAPLMSEPRWWIAGPNDVALREPRRKRKREFTMPTRGGAPSHSGRPRPESMVSTAPSSGFSSGLSASMHASTSRVDDPSQGWFGDAPLAKKATQGQKKALKRERRIAAGIPPNGHKKPVSSKPIVLSSKPRKIRDSDDDGDTTDSVSNSDGEEFTVEKTRFPSVPFDEGLMTDTSALGNSPETPISQLASLASNHETTLLSSAPDHEHEIPVPTTPDYVRAILVDVHLPATSSNPDEPHLSSLSLDDTHIPDDSTK